MQGFKFHYNSLSLLLELVIEMYADTTFSKVCRAGTSLIIITMLLLLLLSGILYSLNL